MINPLSLACLLQGPLERTHRLPVPENLGYLNQPFVLASTEQNSLDNSVVAEGHNFVFLPNTSSQASKLDLVL